MGGQAMTFELVGKELAEAQQWRASHRCRPDAQASTTRGDFSYSFTPGGLGTTIVLTCHLCGQSKNVTDFEVW